MFTDIYVMGLSVYLTIIPPTDAHCFMVVKNENIVRGWELGYVMYYM